MVFDVILIEKIKFAVINHYTKKHQERLGKSSMDSWIEEELSKIH